MKALEKQLMIEGVQTETHVVADMMQRGWEFSKKLGLERHGFYCKENQIIIAVCNLEDTLRRARLIAASLDDGSAVAEVHAMRGDYKKDDVFFAAGDLLRIDGTRICVLKNERALLTFSPDNDKFESDLETMEFASELSKLKGFDLWSALDELEAMYQRIKVGVNRLKVIELPSHEMTIPKRHSMYSYYFSDNLINSNVSEYEVRYFGLFYESIGFSPRDVEAVASVILD